MSYYWTDAHQERTTSQYGQHCIAVLHDPRAATALQALNRGRYLVTSGAGDTVLGSGCLEGYVKAMPMAVISDSTPLLVTFSTPTTKRVSAAYLSSTEPSVTTLVLAPETACLQSRHPAPYCQKNYPIE
jgi:hypothetical protein